MSVYRLTEQTLSRHAELVSAYSKFGNISPIPYNVSTL